MLMYLLSKLTGDRYKPEITWSYFWTHNIFRFYEMIFGRKVGIAVEMTSTAYQHNGKTYVTHKAWSFEAKVALFEQITREFLHSIMTWKMPKLVLVPMYQPMFQMNNSLKLPAIIPSPYRFAIAFDATAASTSPGSLTSPITWTHTCTGSNLILFLGSGGDNGHVTAASYNSVGATSVGAETDSASNSEATLYRLFAPATGANTASMTHGASLYACATSYSGVSQSALDSNAQGHTTVDATSYAKATTVVAANCWLVASASDENDTGCGTQSMSVGTLRASSGNVRNNGSNQFGMIMGDSNGTVGTGSQSLTVNSTTSNHWTTIVASIAPVAANPVFTKNIFARWAVTRASNY